MVKKNWDDMTEKEREDYVSQDNVPSGREKLLPDVDWYDGEGMWPEINFDNPKILKSTIIALYFEDNMPVKEIGYHVPCRLDYIWGIIRKEKKKITEIKRLYDKKMTIEEIASKTDYNLEEIRYTIKKYINSGVNY